MDRLLSIITPCVLPNNLGEILTSIVKSKKQNSIKIDWYIIFDSKKTKTTSVDLHGPDWLNIKQFSHTSPGISGNPQRNYALNLINNGLVYFLDDDNILHPNYIDVILKTTKDDCKVCILSQQDIGWMKRIIRVERGCIDTAQITISRDLIGGIRWEINDYCADSIFIKTLALKHRDYCIKLQQPIAYYNRLNPFTWPNGVLY